MNTSICCPKCGSQLSPDVPSGLCPNCLVRAGFQSETVLPPQSNPKSSRFEPPTIEQLANKFPQLEILELLGRGGMGAVYKARQHGLDRLVAIKILPPEIGHDAAFAERFTREARALARLTHSHIVTIYDFGQTLPSASTGEVGKDGVGSLFYILMEYVDGVNLRQTIQSGHLSPAQALAIIPQICEALQYAHDKGIVHRDIKPENVLLDKDGQVKIADFGLAKLLDTDVGTRSLTGTNQVMGTMQYMAPEQLTSSPELDHRADIFSLGVVFYELLTGQLPIGRFALPSKKVHVDVRLDEIVLRAIEQEPDLRYQRAAQMKSDLETMARTTAAPFEPVASNPETRATSELQQDAELCREALIGAFVLPISLFVTPSLATLGMIATSILGFLAIHKIKRSRGKLYRLRLAISEAILFPLLLLYLMIAGCISALYLFVYMSIPFRPDLLFRSENAREIIVALLAGNIVALIVCVFVGRAAWRAFYRINR